MSDDAYNTDDPAKGFLPMEEIETLHDFRIGPNGLEKRMARFNAVAVKLGDWEPAADDSLEICLRANPAIVKFAEDAISLAGCAHTIAYRENATGKRAEILSQIHDAWLEYANLLPCKP